MVGSEAKEGVRQGRERISLITPAYNEAANLPTLYGRIAKALDEFGVDWQWIVVDDHSSDGTFSVVGEIAEKDNRVRIIRFSRNHGSHKAIRCGLDFADGDCAIVLAADLQDPPETIPALIEEWRNGRDIVWAVRNRREGARPMDLLLARAYYFVMRRVVGVKEMAGTGADFFLLDRRVIDSLKRFGESHVSVLALLSWMGFRQGRVLYDKQARQHGRSGWTFEKKLKLLVDSVTSFSYLPIRFISCFGFLVASAGFVYACVVIVNTIVGYPPAGWTSLMVVVLVIGGLQLVMMGVLGEYLWRALDEARGRPKYVIEDAVGFEATIEAGTGRSQLSGFRRMK